MSIKDFNGWFKERKNKVNHVTEAIKFSDMKKWGFDERSGNLVHETGKFFSIEGVQVKTNWGNVANWTQPIINQPEIGFLGIITKQIDGVLYFLMQAKTEPGNINSVQLSPTLQATKSNYTQIHKGNTPPYLEYFIGKRGNVTIILDQLQSEQGARFLQKRNRNIIIEVSDTIEVKDDFCWLTLGQIKQLLQVDNVVNMDTRTLLAGITYGDSKTLGDIDYSAKANTFEESLINSELGVSEPLHSLEEIISWVTNHKFFAELEVNQIPLRSVIDWNIDDTCIRHKDGKYFSVIAVNVEIGNREVLAWSQPLVKSAQEGIIAFITKKINGVLHFLVQAKLECGNFDILELAPTVQCLTGNYRKGLNEYEVDYLDYILQPENYGAKVRYSAFQSEEGGRFYREQNKNIIIEVDDSFNEEVPDKFIWMTLYQLKAFVKFNNYLNIQARSLLSMIKFV